jgi:hypothetical protein
MNSFKIAGSGRSIAILPAHAAAAQVTCKRSPSSSFRAVQTPPKVTTQTVSDSRSGESTRAVPGHRFVLCPAALTLDPPLRRQFVKLINGRGLRSTYSR